MGNPSIKKSTTPPSKRPTKTTLAPGTPPDRAVILRIDPRATRLELHPFAELTPPMNGREFAALCEDVRIQGVKTPVNLIDGKLADGRHRWLACQQLGVTCPAIECGDDPRISARIFAANVTRRSLKPSQLALMAAKWATRGPGSQANVAQETITQLDLARRFGISRQLISLARRLLKSARADLIDAVWKGDLALKAIRDRIPARPMKSSSKRRQVSDTAAGPREDVELECGDRRARPEAGSIARPSRAQPPTRMPDPEGVDIAEVEEPTAAAASACPPGADLAVNRDDTDPVARIDQLYEQYEELLRELKYGDPSPLVRGSVGTRLLSTIGLLNRAAKDLDLWDVEPEDEDNNDDLRGYTMYEYRPCDGPWSCLRRTAMAYSRCGDEGDRYTEDAPICTLLQQMREKA